MFIDDSTYTRNNKTYRRVLLRNSYRVNGVVRHDTIANLSNESPDEIKAIKLALNHKHDLSKLTTLKNVTTHQGLAVGAVWLLFQLAKRIGITSALGNTQLAKLNLWLIFSAIIAQGSRLSAVRLAQQHQACDILGLDGFNEDALYGAMDWIAEHQQSIEQKIFKIHFKDEPPTLYLYDVTSSYFEGQQNELADYGYNRDGKRGKKQIVIGLMTDGNGWPIAIEVFRGNTSDMMTVEAQIKKMAERFGVKEVTLVGDRGMIRGTLIDKLGAADFHYITAITKPQIESLIKQETIQMDLFDEDLVEVVDGNTRYFLRRNPTRAEEIESNRQSKLASVQRTITQKNLYLQTHKKAKVTTAIKEINSKIKKLKIHAWAFIEAEDRTLNLRADETEKEKISRLDGCYVIKTDLSQQSIEAEKAHARYKDLAQVEYAFRTMKTVLLEMRGIYVRKANRTRAHVFIVMLAYMLIYQLRRFWQDIELTVEEGIAELGSICSLEIHVPGQGTCQTIPNPRPLGKLLLEKAKITLPDAIPCRGATVVTRKKLVSERKFL